MTPSLFRYSVLIAATALALTSPMRAQSGHELFQQALSKERAEGKLQEAIALYQRVVEVASADHALAARALLQLGRCYEQLGNTEARSAYERLIARYPDQTDLVAQARTRLAALVRTPSTATPPAVTVQPLLDVSKTGELLAVAPDGTKAIVMDYSGGQNIALHDFVTKQTRPLTDLGWVGGYAYYAVWSPDARRVAYQWTSMKGDTSELRVTTLDGQSTAVYRSEGAPFPFVQPVGWTPDGAALLMVAARPDKTWTVGTVPANGGRFTPLRSFGWSYDWRGEPPRLSPDGRFVAYLEGERGQRDVHVVSLDGRDTYRITDHPADDWGPVWSPDSRHLAFMSNRLGSVSLWAVEVKDGKPVAQATKVKDGMQSARSIDWTGRGVFYDQQTTTWDLYTVPMDTVEARASGSPSPIAYSRTGRNVSPVWSPDGGRLAFVSSAASEPTRRYVVVMPADGGQAREFLIPTTSWEYPSSPPDLRWFGDGRGLGFSGLDTRGAPAVFRLVLATGEWDTFPLPHLAQAWRTRTEWNRDGSAFYFSRDSTSDADEGGIFERAVNGDAERLVYRAPPSSNIRGLELGPDRKWLVFRQQTFSGNFDRRILLLDVETGDTRTLLENVMKWADLGRSATRLSFVLGWTPSGDLLVERRGPEGTVSEVVLAPVNGGAPRAITLPTLAIKLPTLAPDGPAETQRDLVAKWSPAGKTMVLGRASRGAETFVIEHPLANVRATTASR